MTTASDALIELVRARGPMTFADYQRLALYHPQHGYYVAGRVRSGWSGHYITSAQLDPAFGELWAGGFEQIWVACGSPSSFEIVELGPGEGAFAASVLQGASERFRHALSYRLVERSPELRARQEKILEGEENVAWVIDVTEAGHVKSGCVIANEVLDNQAVHVVERRDGQLVELWVEESGGRLERHERPLSDPAVEDFLIRTGMTPAEDGIVEVPLEAESIVRNAASMLDKGALIFVDYGAEATELVAKPEGTVVCYSASGADDDPLDRPGEKDITSHANWTSVRDVVTSEGLAPVGPVKQRDVLLALGLPELVASAKEAQETALAAGRGADGFRAIARRQALATLADPAGLGGLDVFAALKGIEAPAFLGL